MSSGSKAGVLFCFVSFIFLPSCFPDLRLCKLHQDGGWWAFRWSGQSILEGKQPRPPTLFQTPPPLPSRGPSPGTAGWKPWQPPPSGGMGLYIAGVGGWASFHPPSLPSEIICCEITGYDGAGGFASFTGFSCCPWICSSTHCFARGMLFSFPQHSLLLLKRFA